MVAANNAAGSGQAYLTIHVDSIAGSSLAPVAARLLNVSTRLAVQNGDNVLIGGFIVTGTVPKDVVVRGLGPLLAPLASVAPWLIRSSSFTGQVIKL